MLSLLTRDISEPTHTMPATIHALLPQEHTGWVLGPELGEPGKPLTCAIVGVSCYPGEQVTFWIRGGPSGWLYSYVPAHYLALTLSGALARHGTPGRAMLVPAASKGFTVDTPIQSEVRIDGEEYKALAMIDFLNCNELFWVLARARDGVIVVSTHRYFDAAPPPGGLRKMRQTWI